jgi:HEAT repeat protein
MAGVASGLSENNKVNPNENILNMNEQEKQQAIEPLIQALGAENINSRKEARFALEKMGEEAVDSLIKVIDSEETPEIRCEAALALGNIGGQEAEKP